jgi:DeoR family ulaG and ulaABCDEF operon transcriptional repressor
MHAAEREKAILGALAGEGFVSFRELQKRLTASPATLRRDLDRLEGEGLIARVHGGAHLVTQEKPNGESKLSGVPFHENINRNRAQKEAIGKAAAALCVPGEGVMIDGGSTTLQMCPHLAGLNLQVLTNSLHIVSALLNQAGTGILLPGGALFREQNIILSAAGDDLMPRFHAPRLFMGAAAVGAQGIMQADIILVAAERRFIARAEEVVLLVDSSKFHGSSGSLVCALDEVDVVVTDRGVQPEHVAMLDAAGARVVIAD